MKRSYFLVATVFILTGCSPPPSPHDAHFQQIKNAITNAGGVTAVLNQSQILFSRLAAQHQSFDFLNQDNSHFASLFAGISAITNLGPTNIGPVFRYYDYEPDRVQIRIYNSHRDLYFIYLLNTNFPEPTNFERVAGNVGVIQ